jgi:hypothetical protein
MLLILLEDCSREPPLVAQFITRVFGTNFERGAAVSDFSNNAATGILGSRKYEGDCLAGRQSPHAFRLAMRGDRGQGKTEGETVRKSFRFPERVKLCLGEVAGVPSGTPRVGE